MTKIDGGLRALFREHIPQLAWTSVETGGTTSGVSDSNYLARGGIEGWVEFKQTEASRIQSYTPFQAAWIHRRWRYGGRSWIACRRWHRGGKRRGPPVDELWMVPGMLAPELRSGGLLGLEKLSPANQRWLWRWRGGPLKWDWDAVVTCLCMDVTNLHAHRPLG